MTADTERSSALAVALTEAIRSASTRKATRVELSVGVFVDCVMVWGVGLHMWVWENELFCIGVL